MKLKRNIPYYKLQAVLFIAVWFSSFWFSSVWGQESGVNSWKELISLLEDKHKVSFYYLEQTLPNTPLKVNSLDNLEDVLIQMVEGTNLNYFFYQKENRVFLIQNGYVYEDFPLEQLFYKDTTTSNQNEQYISNISPVLLSKGQQSATATYPTLRIGKIRQEGNKSEVVISGVAQMEKTGIPVTDLVVQLLPENRVVVTDSLGRFELQVAPGYHQLKTSAMGTATSKRDLIVYDSGNMVLPIRESLEVLDEVVVQADAKRNIEETNTGTEVIDLEENKNVPVVFGERDLLQIAKALPGISSAGEGASGLNVRGGKTDQNLVLLDEGVIYNPSHFFGIFQALNPFATQGAEIYKGNFPMEYGGRLSSLINISSIQGDNQKVRGEGSIGPVTGNLALQLPMKKDTSSLVVAGRAAYANWILQALDDPELSNSEASFFDVMAKYRHEINQNNILETTIYGSADDFSITSDSLYKYSNLMGSVSWIKKKNEQTTQKTVLYHSSYGFGIDFETEASNSFDLNYTINETGLRYKKNKRNGNILWIYGIDNKYYSVNPGSIDPLNASSTVQSITIPREQGVEGAIFLGNEISLSERFDLNLGVRLTYFANLGAATVQEYQQGQPRNASTVVNTMNYSSGEVVKTYLGPEFKIGAKYMLDETTSIKGSVGNSFQYLHTLSNNTTVSPIDTWKLSDFHIEPQRAIQASAGIFKNFDANNYELSIEGYYRRMDNVLDFKTGASLFLNQNVETEILQGDGKAYGVEFLLKKNSGKLNGWLSYTYSRSFYRFNGNFPEERINAGNFFPSNYDRPHDLSLITNFRLTRRFSFSGNFVYQTGRPVTYPIGRFQFNNANFVAFSNRNEFRIPDFYRLDLGFNIEGNHKKNKLAHSFVTIQVYNVLGRNNPFSQFFVTDNGEIRAFESSIFAVPIPSITYNFKF